VRRLRALMIPLLLVATLAGRAGAATYRVGPTRRIKSLKPIAETLKPGDVVEIDPGTYREVMELKANGTKDRPIVIRGVGRPRPVFDAEGLNVNGRGPIPRAIFQVEGADYVIEHLEFRNARNGHNGAGIRLLASTNVVIRDCYLHHCDIGIFGDDRETATIEACEVAFNSTAKWNGYAHNFYMHGNRVVLRHCYIHDCPYGQNYKTRAHYNELWYNWIVDSHQGEVGPVDGRGETDRPNSNVLMVGNVIVSPPKRTGNPSKFVLFGSELKGGSHDGTLFMFHNTLIAGSPEIIFVQLYDVKARAVIRNNVFYGSKRILRNARKPLSVVGSHNWVPADADVPKEFTDTITGTAPGFLNLRKRDFRLRPTSACVNRGASGLTYVDGDGVKHRLSVDQSYLPHMKLMRRIQTGTPDLGAYELGALFKARRRPSAGLPPGRPPFFPASGLTR